MELTYDEVLGILKIIKGSHFGELNLETKKHRYTNAGTIEFILDQDINKFYFLKMNTRIQVEYPITEMVSDLDLVQEQICVAAGNPLSIAQSEVKLVGHSIER